MRLSARQVDVICNEGAACFGGDARLWLFGSRVDDQKRGGDIDLYIESETLDSAALLDAKIHFLMQLHNQLGEQKIDVVLHRMGSATDLPIYRVAQQEGVRLL
ncbi:MAG: nucleotidyltransferase domain-containing protein [Mariprofundales bacterium]